MLKAIRHLFLAFLFQRYIFANQTDEKNDALKDCIRVPSQSTRRVELLQRFLAAKTYENSEKIVN